MRSRISHGADVSRVNDRARAWTLLAFICGLSALLCAIVLQSGILVRAPYLVHHAEMGVSYPYSEWEEIISDMLTEEVNENYCENQSHSTSRSPPSPPPPTTTTSSPLSAITFYQFDFILAGEGTFSEDDRKDFFWVTSRTISDALAVHSGGVAKVSISRRELGTPFGLLPYYRTSTLSPSSSSSSSSPPSSVPKGRKSSSSNGDTKNMISSHGHGTTNNQHNNNIHDDSHGDIDDRCNSASSYILANDIKFNRVPMTDILDSYSDISSRCAADPGCSYIRMVFYVVPKDAQPLYIVSSLSSLPSVSSMSPGAAGAAVSDRSTDGGGGAASSSSSSSTSPSQSSQSPPPASIRTESEATNETVNENTSDKSKHCKDNPALITGVTITGKASIVIANIGHNRGGKQHVQYLHALLGLSREHLRDLLRLPPRHRIFGVESGSRSRSSLESGSRSPSICDGRRSGSTDGATADIRCGDSGNTCVNDFNGVDGVDGVNGNSVNGRNMGSDGSAVSSRVSPADILSLKAGRVSSLFTSALAQLSAARELYTAGIDQIHLRVDQSTADQYNIAMAALLKCQRMLRNSSNVRDSIRTVGTLDEMHALALEAILIANTLTALPALLPLPYFPLDQLLVMYAPYWVPILVPLAKGVGHIVMTWRRGSVIE